MERNLAALVKRAHGYGERLATGVALEQAGAMGLASHERCFANRAAMWADRAIGPKASLKPFTGLGFIMEDRIGKIVHGRNLG